MPIRHPQERTREAFARFTLAPVRHLQRRTREGGRWKYTTLLVIT